MFFKRLHVHGFKSFANKTEISLPPGVSVIVGPNGCGKSNVFDSIKWVLGEQSAKSLRGARMKDVIFAGSPSKGASPHSEVTLEMNNAGGVLGTDEEEVVITRRLFRTGESEYFMNGRPSRLRDIQRLMMGTGVGQNSYAVMQQGKVAQIINSRPDGRRYIIEEAAGISKYKVHKDEALRRLARTEEDLQRITDLLGEVKSNGSKLRKQAEKARDYQRLTAELRKHDMVLLARRYEEIIAEQSSVDDHYSDLSNQLEAFDSRIEELEVLNESRREEMEELAALFEAAQEAHREAEREQTETAARTGFLDERLIEIGERRQRLLIEIENNDDRCDEHDEEIANLELTANDLEVTIREDEISLQKKQSRVDSLKDGMSEQDEELVSLRESFDALQTDKVELEGELKFARQMLEKIADRETNEEQVRELEAQLKEKKGAAEAAKQTAFKTQEEHETTQSELGDKKRSMTSAEQALRELQKKRDDVVSGLRTARSRLGALQQLQENYDGFVRGVKEVMVAADANRLPGVVGVVATLVRPKDGMESAIEVALGGAVQNIIAETAQDAKAAIELLKRKNAGRASFLPLDIVQPRHQDKRFNALMKLPGVVGWATDLVSYDPHISRAVEYLLGGTIVVEHIDVALAMERKGFRTKYVTLDGDILNPSGVMSGGSYRASGLLTRETEIQALAETAEEYARQLVSMDEEHDKLESTLGHLKASVQELSEKMTKLQVALVSAVKDAEALDREAKSIEKKHDEVRASFDTAEDERTGYQEQIKYNADVVVDLDNQMVELKKRIGELTGHQSERTRLIGEATDAIQELRLKVVRDKERLHGAKTALQRLIDDGDRLKTSVDEKRAELSKLDDEEARLIAEQDSLKERLDAAQKRLTEAKETLEGQSADKKQQIEQLQALSADLQSAQRDRNMLQNELHEAEVKKAQQGAMLQSLQEQAGEKFESSLEAVLAQLEQELGEMEDLRAEEGEAQNVEGGNVDGDNGPQIIEIEPIDGASDEHYTSVSVGTDGEAADSGDREGAPDAPDTMSEGARSRWLDHPLAALPLDALQDEANALRRQIEALGPINLMAIEEYERIEERIDFIAAQRKDLIDARDTILRTIQKIDETTARLFRDCYDAVRANFIELFRRLFGGGKADLILTHPDDIHATGLDIIAQPPGKAPQTISLLSGGEMCLTAIALMFALFQYRPSPFCILDEIDAPLDDANVERFKKMIQEFSHTTQFIVISHNKLTMELGDTIFGVTMQEPGVSKIVSVKFDEIEGTDLLRDAPDHQKADGAESESGSGAGEDGGGSGSTSTEAASGGSGGARAGADDEPQAEVG